MTSNGLTIVLLLLVGITLGAILWGLRQWAITRRVRAVLEAIRLGRQPSPARRGPEDHEPVLAAMDAVVDQFLLRREPQPVPTSELAPIMDGLCQTLAGPLRAIGHSIDELARQTFAQDEQRVRLQSLRGHVDGLLRLLEAPRDLSALRDELSGLRRRLEGMAQSELPECLLVDEESDWSVELKRSGDVAGWRVRVAAGQDALDAFLQSGPRLLLANATWDEGKTWRLLAESPAVAEVPLVLFERADGKVRYWEPSGVWFWPDERGIERFRTKWAEFPPSAQANLLGDPTLIGEIGQALLAVDILPISDSAEPAIVLDHCVTLLALADPQPETGGTELAQILFVPRDRAIHHSGTIARSFADSAWLRPVEESSFRDWVSERFVALCPHPPHPAEVA